MDEASTIEEYKLYELAEKRAKQKFIIQLHVGIYIGINIFLTMMNVITVVVAALTIIPTIPLLPQLWVFYSWIGWGAGLLIHIIVTKTKSPMLIGFFTHGVVSLMLTIILFYINIAYPPIPFFFWVIFPLVAFIGAFTIHGVFMLLYKKIFREDKDGKSWFDRLIEKEAGKIREELQKDV
ncbi:MAG: 2TM domain-containing protein [Candidatus Helarchaeota archaeon]